MGVNYRLACFWTRILKRHRYLPCSYPTLEERSCNSGNHSRNAANALSCEMKVFVLLFNFIRCIAEKNSCYKLACAGVNTLITNKFMYHAVFTGCTIVNVTSCGGPSSCVPVDSAIGLPVVRSVSMCGRSRLCTCLDEVVDPSPRNVIFLGHADLDQSMDGRPAAWLQLPPYQCHVAPLSGDAACPPAR